MTINLQSHIPSLITAASNTSSGSLNLGISMVLLQWWHLTVFGSGELKWPAYCKMKMPGHCGAVEGGDFSFPTFFSPFPSFLAFSHLLAHVSMLGAQE